MTVTDLEISLNCWIGAEVRSEGKVTVPAKQLAEFLNSVPNEKIDVLLDGQLLKVSTLNNSAQFNTIPADDYPSVASITDQNPLLTLSIEDVLTTVNRVAFAAATDDIKPVMTGIKLEIKEDTIAFVGADGLRLSRQVIRLSQKSSSNIELIIPAKAFEELAYIVSEFSSDQGDNTVSLFLIEERNQVVFRYNDIDLISRLIDGQYPAYQQAIPTGYQTTAEIERAEFQTALKVVNIIARGVLGNKLYVDQDPKENVIRMSATQTDLGSNESSFAAKIEGENMKMAFSSRLLAEMLSHVGGEKIIFESSSATSAGVFKIKGDDTFIHLVMPMRL